MNRRRSHLPDGMLLILLVLAIFLVFILARDRITAMYVAHVWTAWRDCAMWNGYCYLPDRLQFAPMMG